MLPPTATFTFSLDCEGKWGVADHLDEPLRLALTTERLEHAYARLVRTFDAFNVPATWAFVSAFVMDEGELLASMHLARESLTYSGGDWNSAFRRDAEGGRLEGWTCPQALSLVTTSGAHEVAAHGYSHRPLTAADVSQDEFRLELELMHEFWQSRRLRPTTFVYPRNAEGHVELLVDSDFVAYRPAHPRERSRTSTGRLTRLLGEVIGGFAPSTHSTAARPLALPPGRFLSYAAGARRLIPRSRTLATVRRLLEAACESRRAVHLYSHPHNFVTDPGLFGVLELVLAQVERHVRRGDLTVLTQAEYARLVLSPT